MRSACSDNIVESVMDFFEKERAAAARVRTDGEMIHVRYSDHFVYQIPLDECTSASGALSWVRHMHQKSWIDDHLFMAIVEQMIEHVSINGHV